MTIRRFCALLYGWLAEGKDEDGLRELDEMLASPDRVSKVDEARLRFEAELSARAALA